VGHAVFGNRKNKEILEDLQVEPVDEKLTGYKSNWLRHVRRMNTNRMPKIVLNYRPKWMKTTWKTFEETVRRGRNRSVKA
jgi:predicted Zn-dependent protease with MMP-like domain